MTSWKAILFLLASGQGLILSFALIVKGLRSQLPQFFLGLILFIISLELLNAWGMQVHYHGDPHRFPFWTLQSYLVLPPSIWFFAQLSTSPTFTFRRIYGLAYLPAGLEVLVQLTWSYLRREMGLSVPRLLDNPSWFFCTELLPILGTAGAVGWFGYKLTTLPIEKQGRFPAVGPLVKRYSLFGFLLVLTLLWAAGVLLHWSVFAGVEVLLMLFLFAYAYLGYLDASYFTLYSPTQPKTAEKLSFSHYNDSRHWERLKAVFEQEALYTQSRLSLEEVADRLHLPGRYVSYLINRYYGANFNQYVNTLRVEAVIRKMSDPAEQHKTLLALALEAGFNSKSTFNQAFRMHTGLSPSHYLARETKAVN